MVYDKKLVFLLYKDLNHEENEHNIKKAKHIKENSLKYNHIIRKISLIKRNAHISEKLLLREAKMREIYNI